MSVSNLEATFDILLFETSIFTIYWFRLFANYLSPSSVILLFENWQLSMIFASFMPADIALIYLSPNFCPFKLRTFASPVLLINPIQHGKTLRFSATYKTGRVGSLSKLCRTVDLLTFLLHSNLSNFL